MDLSESIFWMNGRLATNCVELSEDPQSLDKDGYWVTLQSFEGKYQPQIYIFGDIYYGRGRYSM